MLIVEVIEDLDLEIHTAVASVDLVRAVSARKGCFSACFFQVCRGLRPEGLPGLFRSAMKELVCLGGLVDTAMLCLCSYYTLIN